MNYNDSEGYLVGKGDEGDADVEDLDSIHSKRSLVRSLWDNDKEKEKPSNYIGGPYPPSSPYQTEVNSLTSRSSHHNNRETHNSSSSTTTTHAPASIPVNNSTSISSPQRPTSCQSSYKSFSPKSKNIKDISKRNNNENIIRASSAPNSVSSHAFSSLFTSKSIDQFPIITEADYLPLSHDDLIQKLVLYVDINDPDVAFHTAYTLLQIGFSRWIDFIELPVSLFPHLKLSINENSNMSEIPNINSQNYPFLSSLSSNYSSSSPPQTPPGSKSTSTPSNNFNMLSINHLHDNSIMLSCRNLFNDAGIPLLISSKLASYIISYHYFYQSNKLSSSSQHPMYHSQSNLYGNPPRPSSVNIGFRYPVLNNFNSRPPSTS